MRKSPTVQALTTRLGLRRANLIDDATAGFTFAVVNIPQAMANALLAGVNPILGLYTLMIATPVGAIFTSSVFMNVSTTSALSVAAGDALVGLPASVKSAHMMTLVLLVGVFQLLAGVFRLGSLLRFVSHSVMVGFINGVAALIILGQLGDFTGYDSIFQNKVLQLADLILHLGQVDIPTMAISLLTLLIIWGLGYTGLKRFAMLIGLAVATLVASVIEPAGLGTVGDIVTLPDRLVELGIPDLWLVPNLAASAMAIAIVGLVQGAGVSQSYPNPNGKYPNVSRDFFGQGMANLATSFLSGIPGGGSMSGTALTVGTGARTRWANIFAGVFVLPLVLLGGGLVVLIPMPALAALLIVVGIQSLKIGDALSVWRTGRVPGTAMALTFASTLILPLQFSVFVGVAVSVLLHVLRSSNQVRIVQWEPVPGGFPIERAAPATLPDNAITILEPYGTLFFAAAATAETLLPQVGRAERAIVILLLRGRDEVGSTLLGVLERYARQLQEQGGQLMLVGVGPHVMEQLIRTGTSTVLGPDAIFPEQAQIGLAMANALKAAEAKLAQPPV